ncbi:hypothetical protein ABKN59_011334 [Abortiporus biennis]
MPHKNSSSSLNPCPFLPTEIILLILRQFPEFNRRLGDRDRFAVEVRTSQQLDDNSILPPLTLQSLLYNLAPINRNWNNVITPYLYTYPILSTEKDIRSFRRTLTLYPNLIRHVKHLFVVSVPLTPFHSKGFVQSVKTVLLHRKLRSDIEYILHGCAQSLNSLTIDCNDHPQALAHTAELHTARYFMDANHIMGSFVLSGLHNLTIAHHGFHSDSLSIPIYFLPHLRKLTLFRCYITSRDALSISLTDQRNRKHSEEPFIGLHTLELIKVSLTTLDEDLQRILFHSRLKPLFKNLQVLRIIDCIFYRYLTPETFHPLPNLRTIHFSGRDLWKAFQTQIDSGSRRNARSLIPEGIEYLTMETLNDIYAENLGDWNMPKSLRTLTFTMPIWASPALKPVRTCLTRNFVGRKDSGRHLQLNLLIDVPLSFTGDQAEYMAEIDSFKVWCKNRDMELDIVWRFSSPERRSRSSDSVGTIANSGSRLFSIRNTAIDAGIGIAF